ncbi:MAG: O-antigen ligase family protein [Saprospiraceae bacterium]
MASSKAGILSSEQQNASLFKFFGLVVLLSIFTAIMTSTYYIAALPAIFLVLYVTIVDFKQVFFWLYFFIPLGMAVNLPGGLSTDLPTEPLMVGLMLVYFIYVLQNGKRLNSQFFRHPLTLLLLLHLGWTYVATLSSSLFFVSLKFSLAKTWYVTVFYFMAGSLLKDAKDVKRFFWYVFVALSISIIFILSKHLSMGLLFKDANRVVWPFYQNHVDYASIIALFIPMIWYVRKWYPRWSFLRMVLSAGLVLFFVALWFTYTRAAYLAVIASIGTYYMIQWRLTKYAVIIASIGIVGLATHLVTDNTYMDYAPDFEKAVTHKNFDNLVEATAKMEDVSTMERVHRWVAGGRMSTEKPLLGFGPGNFYFFYKSYALGSFKTYVSNNPEKSGIHCYYLMILVEQGFIGALIFLLFCFYIFLKAETIYHEAQSAAQKHIVLLSILSIVAIATLLIINDMIETDKVGPFFFTCVALIVNVDLNNQRTTISPEH